jgi:phosphatidylinositol alpha-mannosyltransferase
VSDAGASYAASLTDQPITIIPNGIDLTKYKQRSVAKSAEDRIILYIGRLEGRKGAKYLLQAFQLFSQDNPDVRLVIAGDGPDREKLELLAEDLKITNIEFLGYISEELKLELLAKAEVFCSPAIFGESFGIVLLEAMATGTVAIAGNNDGYIDLMEGLGGLSIVNPKDTEEFARRLALLMNEEAVRKLWQKWAAGHVKQYNYPYIVDRYEELYEDALKQHGSH